MTLPLLKLSTPAIASLAGAIRNGRVTAPFSGIALREYATEPDNVEIAAELQRLVEWGMTAAHIAYLLEAITGERALNEPTDRRIELVWSGPESPQAATRDTGVVVRGMFARAKSSVLVAGYAIYQGRRIFKELCQRMDALPNLRVRMFLNITRPYHDERSDAELLESFGRSFIENDWPGFRRPEVFCDPRGLSTYSTSRASLHAKCVVVDGTEAFVTSANFTEAAQERNIEVGVLIRIPSFSKGLADQFENLVNHGLLLRVPGI